MVEGPRSSGVAFFCFHALGDKKQKKPTPLNRGPPLHVNRVLSVSALDDRLVEVTTTMIELSLVLSKGGRGR